MARIETDFENVENPVQPGQYLFEVTAATLGTAKSDGSTNITWEFTILEEGDFCGRKLFYTSYLADKKLKADGSGPDVDAQKRQNYYLREFLKAIGAPWDPGGFDTDTALKCRGVAQVVLEQYEGRQMARVKAVMPVAA